MNVFKVMANGISYALFTGYHYFRWILPFSFHPNKGDLLKRAKLMSDYCNRVIKSLDLHFHVEGLEYIKNGETYYFVANHQQSLDPVVILAAINNVPVAPIGKYELRHAPIVGRTFKALGGRFLIRDDVRQTLKEMAVVEKELKEGKRSWLIFPEGTRNKDHKKNMAPFHPGSFRPALKSKVSIIPICVFGTHRAFNLLSPLKKKPIYLKFLKPIPYEEYQNMTSEQIAKKVQYLIGQDLMNYGRVFDHHYNLKVNYSIYKLFKD